MVVTMKLETKAQIATIYSLINFELCEPISARDSAKCTPEPKIAIFSPTPAVVTMNLGNNAQSVTSCLLINFEVYEAISA